MSYLRVVPRDLFNESMLLKCLGRIAVDILDGKLTRYGVSDHLEDETEGFKISQDQDGGIYCENYKVMVEMPDGDKIILDLFHPLNSRINYPLLCNVYIPEPELINVFTEEGKYTKEFISYLRFIHSFEG